MSADPADQQPLLLFVAPYFPPGYYGGVVQVYLGLLERLEGYRVVVVTDRQNTTAEDQAAWDEQAAKNLHFTVKRIGAFEFHLNPDPAKRQRHTILASAQQIAEFFSRGRHQWKHLLAELRPDLVLCGGTYSAGWLMQYVPHSTPLINYVHGEELTMQLRPRLVMAYMRRKQMHCLRKATLNIAVSTYTAELVKTLANISNERIEVLPNFVDTNRFRISGNRAEFRKKFGWESTLVLLSLARLEPRKGIDQALRALALLQEEGRLPEKWTYVIAGQGKERAALETLSQNLGISHHVVFQGFVPDQQVPELYEAADIFLQPNRDIDGDTEGFGIVFLEASACGVPVIGGKAGGTANAIEENVSGYRVDGDAVPEIAAAIAKLVNNPELRASLGSEGAKRVATQFTVEKTVALFQQMLQKSLLRQ